MRVGGNAQAQNPKRVGVTRGSTVGGSIQIKQGAEAAISGVKVDSDIQFESNARAERSRHPRRQQAAGITER